MWRRIGLGESERGAMRERWRSHDADAVRKHSRKRHAA